MDQLFCEGQGHENTVGMKLPWNRWNISICPFYYPILLFLFLLPNFGVLLLHFNDPILRKKREVGCHRQLCNSVNYVLEVGMGQGFYYIVDMGEKDDINIREEIYKLKLCHSELTLNVKWF